jgi:hypothetical protein
VPASDSERLEAGNGSEDAARRSLNEAQATVDQLRSSARNAADLDKILAAADAISAAHTALELRDAA